MKKFIAIVSALVLTAAAFEIAVPFMIISIIVTLFNIFMCVIWF